jgi:hypothetical protein
MLSSGRSVEAERGLWKGETSQNAPMRLFEPATNPLSICRNFGGFRGIYEQEFNGRAIGVIDDRFPAVQ